MKKYVEQIRDYSMNMTPELQKECQIQVKKLRNQGYSFEWIYRAISHKSVSEWERYNFGLLHTGSYQRQITNLLESERNQMAEIDIDSLSWDSLLQDELSNSESKIKSEDSLNTLFEKYEVL